LGFVWRETGAVRSARPSRESGAHPEEAQWKKDAKVPRSFRVWCRDLLVSLDCADVSTCGKYHQHNSHNHFGHAQKLGAVA